LSEDIASAPKKYQQQQAELSPSASLFVPQTNVSYLKPVPMKTALQHTQIKKVLRKRRLNGPKTALDTA
jgi:hypothetical protein